MSPAARAQMAVYDAANHVETSQTLAQALKLVDQGQQALSQLNAMKSAIGTVGGISSGVSSSLRSLNGSIAPPAMNLSSWSLPRDLQAPDFSSMSSSRSFLDKAIALTPDKNGNMAYGDRDSATQRRQLAARDAAMNGYALALAQRQQIQPALERVATAADEADAAPDEIAELHQTNKLLAVIAGELVAQRSLMAAMLEMTASKALQEQPVLFTSSGATNFALPGAPAPLGN